jgi:hypothetical protein
MLTAEQRREQEWNLLTSDHMLFDLYNKEVLNNESFTQIERGKRRRSKHQLSFPKIMKVNDVRL